MTSHKPPDWSTVAPRIVTNDAGGLSAFIRAVFDGVGEDRVGAPTQIRIGDSMLLISDGGGLRHAMPAFLHVYVPDADATCEQALAAGAQLVEAAVDTPYGDRRATIRDAWGNLWQIATHRA